MDKFSIEKVVTKTGIELAKAKSIWVRFSQHFDDVMTCAKKVEGLEITDITQKDEMALARETRIALKKIRVSAEKLKKELKADIIKEGKFIDATCNLISDATKPLEEDLKEKEEFAKRREAERVEKLVAERKNMLRGYVDTTRHYPLADMTDEQFDNLLASVRETHEKRLEAERKAEEERLAREKAEAEERARIEAENARLRAEAEERERLLAEERARAEAALAAERAKADEERLAREEAVRKEKEERAAAERAEREERERLLAEERARAEADLAKERAKLKAERQAREAAERVEREKLEAERERQQEVLRKAQEAQAAAERALREKQEAEERARREEEERIQAEKRAKEKERRRIEVAGDREKLNVYFDAVTEIEIPVVKCDAARLIIHDFRNEMLAIKSRVDAL